MNNDFIDYIANHPPSDLIGARLAAAILDSEVEVGFREDYTERTNELFWFNHSQKAVDMLAERAIPYRVVTHSVPFGSSRELGETFVYLMKETDGNETATIWKHLNHFGQTEFADNDEEGDFRPYIIGQFVNEYKMSLYILFQTYIQQDAIPEAYGIEDETVRNHYDRTDFMVSSEVFDMMYFWRDFDTILQSDKITLPDMIVVG